MHLKTVHEGKPVDRIIARALDVPLKSSDLQVEILTSGGTPRSGVGAEEVASN